MLDESIIRLRVVAPTLEDLKAFIDEVQADVGCRAVARRGVEGFALDVYVAESQVQAVRDSRTARRVALETVENATEVGRQRQLEVGQGDRYAARDQVPRGLGRKE